MSPTDEPNGKSTVSNLDLFERMVRLDAKVDTFTTMIAVQQDHEARIRKLERWTYALPPTLMLAATSVFIALRR